MLVNGPYNLHNETQAHPYLMISYEKCPNVKDYFRLVAVGDGGYAKLAPSKEQKKCIETLRKGDRVSVVIESTINHFSGLKSWDTKTIQNCDMSNIYGGVQIEGVQKNDTCTWIE